MGWWFGRKAAADPRPFVPAWLGTGEQAGFARSYDAQFEEVYRRNPVGQRAVRLVSGMLGALPIHAAEGDERAAAIASADGLLEGIAANRFRRRGRSARARAGGWIPFSTVPGRRSRRCSMGHDVITAAV